MATKPPVKPIKPKTLSFQLDMANAGLNLVQGLYNREGELEDFDVNGRRRKEIAGAVDYVDNWFSQRTGQPYRSNRKVQTLRADDPRNESGANAFYDPQDKTSYVRSNLPDLARKVVHEEYHKFQDSQGGLDGGKPSPVWQKTKEAIMLTPRQRYRADSYNRYIGQTAEVHARIGEWRHDNGLKPGQVLSQDEYEQMKQNVKTKGYYQDLNTLYDDTQILNLLNNPDIVKNSTRRAYAGDKLSRFS